MTCIVAIAHGASANTPFIVSTSAVTLSAWRLMTKPVARITWLAVGFALLGIGIIGYAAALPTALVLATLAAHSALRLAGDRGSAGEPVASEN